MNQEITLSNKNMIIISRDTREQVWAEAYNKWLESRRSSSTRRAYQSAWGYLLNHTTNPPWKIGRADIVHWVSDMRGRGLSDCTIAQRLAAISSFYIFVSTDYTVIRADGCEVPLHNINPANSRLIRPKINPYGKADYLIPAQARALLGSIPRDTVKGKRDLALFMGYLFTARRNTEWRAMQWGHFFDAGARTYYRWSGKGKTDQKAELPPPIWKAVKNYLAAAGRLETMRERDYVFTAIDQPANKPLSMRETGRSLKAYAKRAGLDPRIHVHTLRHTAAMLRKEAGDDVESICRLLAHSSIAVTQIYLHGMEGQGDDSWGRVENLLGL